MSDSIPSAAPDPDQQEQRLPANAEDRKAAAALSSLNTNELGESGSTLPSNADQEALGKAMSRLEIVAGQEPKNKKQPEAQKEEAVKKKAVKVSAEDVGLLVDQLELSKVKATELLKGNEGDVKKALRAFIAVNA